MNNVFKTTSDHFFIQSDYIEVSISILNTNFIKCSAEVGGGFLSESNSPHYVNYCYFYQCSATSNEEGRGGGFVIRNGKAFAKNCCASGCDSRLGGDMMLFNCQQFENMISFLSTNRVHSVWVSNGDHINIGNINVTWASITQMYYGNGLNIYSKLNDFQLKFVNLIQNQGKNGVLAIEGVVDRNIGLYNINIINNTNHVSFIVFNNRAKSSVADSYFCCFLRNQGKSFYETCNSENCFVKFHHCSFDLPNNNYGSIYFSDCSFNVKTIPDAMSSMICEYNYFYSCRINKYFGLMDLNKLYFLLLIFTISI